MHLENTLVSNITMLLKIVIWMCIDERVKDYFSSMTEGEGDEHYVDAPPFMHYHCYYINHSSTPNCFWDRRTGDIYTQSDH